MGGEISVSSEPGSGSVFSFFVMLSPAEESEETASSLDAASLDISFKGRTFLLVEDNAINQEIAAAILNELGAEVDVADNGEEGLDAFLHKDYSLILMDIRMPIMDGLDAARAIRSSGKADAKTVPIIAMTANVMKEDREESDKAGMNGHISKPIDLAELKNTIYAVIGPGAL
jgi:CheY-like chemotaxis protein